MRGKLLVLWLVQLMGYLIPVISIRLLAQRLGTEGWGQMALAQGVGLAAGVVLEFGFNVSAIRPVSRYRDDPLTLRALVSNTLAAQLLLLMLLLAVGLGLMALPIPAMGDHRELVWLGLLWTLPQSMSLQWLFHGLDKAALSAGVSLGARVVGLAATYLMVRAPEDAGIALACQSVSSLLGLVPFTIWTMLPIGWQRPTFAGVYEALREGFALFLYRIGLVGFAAAVPAILAGQSGPTELAFFSGAERIARAGAGLLDPLSSILYPRWARENENVPPSRAMMRGIAGVVLCGLIISAGLQLGAGPLVSHLLGPRFAPALESFRILAWLPLGQAVANAGGTLGLLSQGNDRLVSTTYLATTAIALLWQVWRHPGATGAAALCVGVLAVQGLIFGSVLWRRSRLVPESA